jgi:hypothetical protein
LLSERPRRQSFGTSSVQAWASPEPSQPSTAQGPIRNLVCGLDAWLRRSQGMIEFSDDPTCIFRVARLPAEQDVRLPDGAWIRRGEPILDLHFWNERLPQASASQGLGWGGRFGRRMLRSFGHLAHAIDADPRLSDAVAIRGRLAFAGARNREECQRFGRWFGLLTAEEERLTLGRRAHDAAEDIWLVALTYTFNPGSLRGRSVVRRRDDLWMSRATLATRYGPPAKRTAA